MGDIILFAETARAGDIGHRFLVAKGCLATETQLSEYLQAVNAPITIGANFLAVRADVDQRLDNGTVRKGKEILLVAGINIARFNPGQLGQILNTLMTRLGELGELVTRQMDWGKYSRGELIVERPEFGDWLREIATPLISLTDWQCGPKHLKNDTIPDPTGDSVTPPQEPKNSWLAVLRMILLICTLYFLVGSFVGLYWATQPFVVEALNTKVAFQPVNPKPSIPDPNKDSGNPKPLLQAQISPEDSLMRCLELEQCEYFEEGLEYLEGLRAGGVDISGGLADNKNKFEEAIRNQASEEKKSYVNFYYAKPSEKMKCADEYLRGPRASNAREVWRWKEWAEARFEVEIKNIKVEKNTIGASLPEKIEISISSKKGQGKVFKDVVVNKNSILAFNTREMGLKYEEALADDAIVVQFILPQGNAVLVSKMGIKNRPNNPVELKTMRHKGSMDISIKPEPDLPKPQF